MQQITIFDLLENENTRPVRLIEFFAGYESQALALKYLGVTFEHYKICEWAINSIIAYANLHRDELKDFGKDYSKLEGLSKSQVAQKLFEYGVSKDYSHPAKLEELNKMPEARLRKCYNSIKWTNNLVDISRVKGSDLNINNTNDYLHILTYSFPCGLAGTKIITKNGYKNIEDVTTNDYVLTHKNRFKKVAKTMERISNHYYELKGLGVPKLFLTEEHPLYVFRDGKEQWVKVKDLKETDMFSFNVNQKNIDVDLNNETLWLLGRYVADGWINKALYNSVEFAIAFQKEEEFLENIPKNFLEKFKRNTKGSCYEYRIADKNFQSYCKQFGSGTKNKIIPQWVIDLPKEKLQCFFNGYISGDGHIRFRKKVKQIMFSTVSENLFLSMQQIVAKLYGCICSCYIRKDDRKETFNDSYNCQFNDTNNHRDQIINNDKIYTKIKKIERYNKEVKVYNFEVEEDNSYTCQNVIVHNCQDISAAGKRAGFEKGSGTRSGLLWEVERILSECENKPQVLLMENVTQVHNKKNMRHFEDWISRLDELGYENYYEDLSSVDFGIPQTRKRTFMVSILKSENMNFAFPSKIKLVHRLKHLLDENVDEKYYLSDSMKKYIVANNGKWTGNNDKAIINKSIASTINTGEGSRRCDASNYICDQLEEDFNLKLIQVGNIYNAESNPQAGRVYDSEGLCPTIDTCTGGNRMPKIVVPLKRGYNCEVDMEKDNVDSEKVVEVGNYSKSGYNQTAIVGKNGVAPTVMENHGQVTAVVVAGIGEKKSNSGTQWYQQDRIYDADKVSITIATSYNPWYLYNLRIRKLTENECFRLMGLKDCDTKKVTEEQSMTSSLHLAGDSIVVQVIMAIFGKILGINWEEKIDINGEWWK